MIAKFIFFLLCLNPRHELIKQPEKREIVASYFEEAGREYNLDPALLVFWAFRESALHPDAKGTKRNERGYPQAHGVAARLCREQGYNITEEYGGAMCVAYLLHYGTDKCGSLVRGGAWYLSGKCNRARKKASDRIDSYKRKFTEFKQSQKN